MWSATLPRMRGKQFFQSPSEGGHIAQSPVAYEAAIKYDPNMIEAQLEQERERKEEDRTEAAKV